MELTKQGRAPQPQLPSPAHRSAQVPYPAAFHPGNWGARAPASSYLIVPTSQHPAQVGVPRPSANLTGARPLSRVSLRPPQQVSELRWKEGSLESGRHHLLKTIDSYIADERVGLAKPAEGVELYLCPSQGKAAQILADHLPKEHSGSFTVPGTSVIGVVVWRRPHASSRVPNRQDDSKRQATTSSSALPMISQSQPSSGSSNASHKEVVTADVPPGFGSGVARDDDDLPEYNFVSVSNSAANVTMPQTYRSHQHLPHTSPPTDRVRELIRKYGNRSAAAQPWNSDGDDDDLPEWDPCSQGNLQQACIPQPHYHYQHHEQLQYHSLLQQSQSSLSQAYPQQHQHVPMPVHAQSLTYGHPTQPAQQSYFGVPDRGNG